MAKQPTVASLKKVNTENLSRLGAERLAEILVSVANARPELKRRLRMELAAEQGGEALSLEIDKRLTAYETSRGKISWRQRPTFLRDLEATRALIVDRLEPLDRAAALERLWRLVDTAPAVSGRVRQKGDELQNFYAKAATDLAEVLGSGSTHVEAQRLADSLAANPVGWSRWLPRVLARSPVLALPALNLAFAQSRTSPGWTTLLRLLAAAAGDVDRLAQTYPAASLKTPSTAAELAQHYLGAGRIEAAGDLLRDTAPAQKSMLRRAAEPDQAWESAWIDYLEKSGKAELAQEVRWSSFERTLSAERLREYVRERPDFDDVEAEAEAFAIAAAHHDFRVGLRLLMSWPAFSEANRMIEARESEADVGPDEAELWAGQLSGRYPCAALILLRRTAAAAFRRREFKTSDRLTAAAELLSS